MSKGSKILSVITAAILLFTAVCFAVKLIPRDPLPRSEGSHTRPVCEDCININTATAEELETLPGIGPKLAAAIISYREENGDFEKIGDLLLVPGIGKGKLEQVANMITVGG